MPDTSYYSPAAARRYCICSAVTPSIKWWQTYLPLAALSWCLVFTRSTAATWFGVYTHSRLIGLILDCNRNSNTAYTTCTICYRSTGSYSCYSSYKATHLIKSRVGECREHCLVLANLHQLTIRVMAHLTSLFLYLLLFRYFMKTDHFILTQFAISIMQFLEDFHFVSLIPYNSFTLVRYPNHLNFYMSLHYFHPVLFIFIFYSPFYIIVLSYFVKLFAFEASIYNFFYYLTPGLIALLLHLFIRSPFLHYLLHLRY